LALIVGTPWLASGAAVWELRDTAEEQSRMTHKRRRRNISAFFSTEPYHEKGWSGGAYSQKSLLGAGTEAERASTARPMRGSTRSRPALLARYSAWSAARSSFSESAAYTPVAIPRLMLTWTLDPPTTMLQAATWLRTRSASSQVPTSPQPGATIRNSSPPYLPTES